MKKTTPYLLGIATAGATILAAGAASYYILPQETGNQLVADPQTAHGMAQQVLEAKCAVCHGENPTYSKFVNFLSGGMLKSDVENAQKAFTIKGDPQVRSGNVDYLKMHRVLNTRCMPPSRYTVVHPGSRMTMDDVDVLRLRYTQKGAMRRMFAPIQPGVITRTDNRRSPINTALYNGIVALRENPVKVVLGHKLFFDAHLSTTDAVSCASCHNLTQGGTDNKAKSEGVPGPDGKPQLGGVNAPSVYNTAGNIRQFWDGRAATLEEQAGGPPLNPVEMGYTGPGDWAKIAAKLAQDPDMVELFRAVYGEKGITGETITDAIAAFEKCLTTPDSDFDAYLMGDDRALTPDQLKGMATFIDYGCVSCHGGPTLGGISFEHINTHAPLREHAKGYQEGAFGLADFTKEEKHKDMFRVPNLRNVALTAPYFHTGTVDDLGEAVRIMFRTEVGTEPSATMVKRVVSFLEAQTGKLGNKPLDMLTPDDVAPKYPALHPATEEDKDKPCHPGSQQQ